MEQQVEVRLSSAGVRALSRLVAIGFDESEAISRALVEAADRMAERQALAVEVSALATDPDDRAEMLAVTDLMELLLVSR